MRIEQPRRLSALVEIARTVAAFRNYPGKTRWTTAIDRPKVPQNTGEDKLRILARAGRPFELPDTAAGGALAILFAAAGMTIAYFLAARLGLALLSAPSDVAVFWPASGLAAGILLIASRYIRPALVLGVVAGTVAANVLGDRNILTSLLKGLCNAGEAVLVTWLLERWFGQTFTFGDLRRVVGFLAATCLATAASATGGAATMILFNSANTAAPFLDVWGTWFLSDSIGILVAAPLIVGLAQAWREQPPRSNVIEGLVTIGALALVTLFVVSHPSSSWVAFCFGPFVLPPLLWLAARCHPGLAIAGTFVASTIIILATTLGVGHFGDEAIPIVERTRGAQSALVMVTVYTLVLTGLLSERRTREQRLDRLLGALPAAIYTTDKVGRVTYFNRAAVQLWGTRPQSGKEKWFELARLRNPDGSPMLPDDYPALTCVNEKRAVTDQEVILERFDGTSIPVISSRVPLVDEHNALEGIVNMKLDISKLKRAEDALAERNLQLSIAGEAGLVGSFAYDVDTNNLQISAGYAAIHGLPEGTTEIHRSEWKEGVHPEDLGRVEALRNHAFHNQWRDYSVEYRIVRPIGEIRWIESRYCIAYHNHGRPQRVVGVIIDITQRKQAERVLAERNEQLALAGRVGRIGSFTVDHTTNVVQLSPGCASLYGLPDNTVEMPHDEAWSFVHAEDASPLSDLVAVALSKQRPEFTAQFRIVRPDNGEVRWVETRNLISYGDNGQPLRSIGATIDVTELRAAEEHKSMLIAELDHRVKNTLATVSAVANRTRDDNASLEDFLEAFDGRIRSLADTHTLLSRNSWHGVALADLVRNELAPCMKNDNTVVEGPEVQLSAEAAQTIAMVVHELATNALKYGAFSNSVGRVYVRWQRIANGSGALRLEWQETDGPSVATSTACGYGTSVIRDLIPYELEGTVDHSLPASGARCTFEIPDRWLVATQV